MALRKTTLRMIQIYQRYIRPISPSCCRYVPSCSEYARQAIQRYGLWKGGWKACGRLLRCHPFSRKTGYDPMH